jgi:hypothetical protein
LIVKLIYMLVAVAFLGISASVAKADGVDPIVTTKGCGGTTGTICDPEFLTPGTTTLTVTESFTCDLSGNCTASDSVVNETGAAVGSFTLILSALDSEGQALTYSCGEGGLFNCSQTGPTAFSFSGNTLCSDADDFGDGTFTPDGDECGVIIGLTGTTSEGLFTGDTVTATFSTVAAPEPSSGLLLMAGLMAGLVSLKTLRSNPS